MTTKPIFMGIDLGTSNSAVAVTDGSSPQIVPIQQLVSANSTAVLPTLPSVILMEHNGKEMQFGVWAKEQGAERPDQLISSAKSWLCLGGLGRNQVTLPLHANISHKLSPIAASTALLSYLRDHMSEAWEEVREVVITVPASFDELARNYTLEAAQNSGFKSITLLEEPLAAMYSWMSSHTAEVSQHFAVGDLVLVCDIGGGTTDFSLIAIGEDQGQLKLDRVSVGPHLLLGGDNIDLAIAYMVKVELESKGQSLDEWQFRSLIYQCQKAKEALLDGEQDIFHFSIASSGSDLFASTISSSVSREQVASIVLEGFFPRVAATAYPLQQEASLQEFGLPYASDPTITKHLAQFLHRAAENLEEHPLGMSLKVRYCDSQKILQPTHVLFNGGTVSSPQIRHRIIECLLDWTGTQPQSLKSKYDTAVALGAAYYARLKSTQEGIRIKSGTTQSFYIEVEAAQMPIPGYVPPKKAICIVPQGTDEGVSLELEGKIFALIPGTQAKFRFYASRFRPQDRCGTEILRADEVLEDVIPMSVDIRSDDEEYKNPIPVTLGAKLSELGILELFLENQELKQKWHLTLDVR